MQTSIEDVLPSLIGTCAAFCLLSVVLAIPGTILGLKQKLIIYDGKDDLNGTCLVVMSVLVAAASFAFYPWLGWGLALLSLLLLAGSIRRTYRANKTIGKSLLAVSTKFAVLGLIAVCGLIAISAVAGIRSVQHKKYKEGAMQLATGAAGLGGYFLLKKLIGKLVRDPQTLT